MFLLLLFRFLQSKVIFSTQAEFMEASKKKSCFVLIISENTYNYLSVINNLKAVSRNVDSARDFYVVSNETNPTIVKELNLTSLPALIPVYNDHDYIPYYGPFSYNSLYQYVTVHANTYIPRITTKEELEKFYLTTASGIIIAVDGATEENHRVICSFYYHHFNEVGLAFVDPKLLDKPGYYTYRFFDDSLEEMENLFNCTDKQFQDAIYKTAFPKIHKFDARVANYLEGQQIKFGIFELKLGSQFYLGIDQLKLISEAYKILKFNLTYIDYGMNSLINVRYGFSDKPHDAFYIIDSTDVIIKKYAMEKEFTAENIKEFAQQYVDGKAKQFFQSGLLPKQNKVTDMREYRSDNVIEFTESYFAVIGICYSSDDSLVNLSMVADDFRKDYRDIEFGVFSIAYNDWPGDHPDFQLMPRLLIYSRGQLLLNARAETPESISENILKVYKEQKEKDKEL